MLDLMCSGLQAVRERVAFSTCLSICDYYTFSRNRLYYIARPDDFRVPTRWSACKGSEATPYNFLSSLLVRRINQLNSGCKAFHIIRFNITAVNVHTDPYNTPCNSEATSARPSSVAMLPHVTENSVFRDLWVCGT